MQGLSMHVGKAKSTQPPSGSAHGPKGLTWMGAAHNSQRASCTCRNNPANFYSTKCVFGCNHCVSSKHAGASKCLLLDQHRLASSDRRTFQVLTAQVRQGWSSKTRQLRPQSTPGTNGTREAKQSPETCQLLPLDRSGANSIGESRIDI